MVSGCGTNLRLVEKKKVYHSSLDVPFFSRVIWVLEVEIDAEDFDDRLEADVPEFFTDVYLCRWAQLAAFIFEFGARSQCRGSIWAWIWVWSSVSTCELHGVYATGEELGGF